MAAAARGHLEVAQELVSAGADVNVQNNDGHSALMFAYNGKNQVETLFERYSQYLKEADDETDEEADGGTGPIIREALATHTALVDLLLKNGANASLKDKEGHTAKDFDYRKFSHQTFPTSPCIFFSTVPSFKLMETLAMYY